MFGGQSIGGLVVLKYVDGSNTYAPINSPIFTGIPQAPTPLNEAYTNQIATVSYVQSVAAGGEPLDLSTYALLDSPNFSGMPTVPTPGVLYPANPYDIVNVSYVSKFAELDNPSFTGTPTAPTQSSGTNNDIIATTKFVKNLGYAPLSSPVFTGTPLGPTASVNTNNTQLATTKYVKNQGYAPLANPVFTGTPQGPTASVGTNNTQLATTKYVKDQAYAPLANPQFTGTPTAPTPSVTGSNKNNTTLATTAFVQAVLGSSSSSTGVMDYNPLVFWKAGEATCRATGAPILLNCISTSSNNYGTFWYLNPNYSVPTWDPPVLTGTVKSNTSARNYNITGYIRLKLDGTTQSSVKTPKLALSREIETTFIYVVTKLNVGSPDMEYVYDPEYLFGHTGIDSYSFFNMVYSPEYTGESGERFSNGHCISGYAWDLKERFNKGCYASGGSYDEMTRLLVTYNEFEDFVSSKGVGVPSVFAIVKTMRSTAVYFDGDLHTYLGGYDWSQICYANDAELNNLMWLNRHNQYPGPLCGIGMFASCIFNRALSAVDIKTLSSTFILNS